MEKPVEKKECKRCSACCRVLPLSPIGMSPDHLKYLRTHGLKEDQGFILVPHDCQHLGFDTNGITKEYSCDIHDSPDRPAVCRKFHGQKRIGRAILYVPPGCGFREEENDAGQH